MLIRGEGRVFATKRNSSEENTKLDPTLPTQKIISRNTDTKLTIKDSNALNVEIFHQNIP